MKKRKFGIILMLLVVFIFSSSSSFAASNFSFSNKKVLILGDSLSADFGKYTQAAAKELNGKVTNKAERGKTLSYVKGKAAKTNSVLYNIKNDDWYKNYVSNYPYIIIAAGTNDYAWSAIDTDTVEKATTEIIKKLRKYNSNSKIIVVTPTRRWKNDGTERIGVKKYRTAIKNGCKDFKNVKVISGTSIVKSDEYKKFPKDDANGRLHPKESFAKKKMAKRLATKIKAISW